MANSWFLKIRDTDPMIPSNYVIQTSQPSCTGYYHICAIYAKVLQGDLPEIIADTFTDEMIRALDSHNNSTNVLLKS